MPEETQKHMVSLLKVTSSVRDNKMRHNKPRRHRCSHGYCWACSKEKNLFYFELVLLTSLCVAAVCVLILAGSLVIKGGAALALWGVLRTITKHITSNS